MGITNTLGTIPGFVGPTVVGALTDGNVSYFQIIYVYFTELLNKKNDVFNSFSPKLLR